jgi:hypothetical protein
MQKLRTAIAPNHAIWISSIIFLSCLLTGIS